MKPQVHSDYAALISDAISYLKETTLAVLSTKEEWEALRRSPLPSPAPPTARKLPPLPPMKSSPASMPPPERIAPQPPPSSNDSHPIKVPILEKKGERPAPREPQKDASKIQSFLQRSSFPLSERIPDDAAATRSMLAYKEHIGDVDAIFFASDTDPDTLTLVKNLSKSIDEKLGAIKVLRPDRLEREERWDLFLSKNRVKLIIATCGFTELKNANAHYTPLERGSPYATLSGIPLIILLPCASYTNSPKEKLLLWNQLCTLLKR